MALQVFIPAGLKPSAIPLTPALGTSPLPEPQTSFFGCGSRFVITAVAAVAFAHRSRRIRLAARESAEEKQALGSFFEVLKRGTRRREAFAAVTGAAVAPTAASAYTDAKLICSECVGSGIIPCVMCLGSGQFRQYGADDDPVGMFQAAGPQFVDCPQCYGVGKLLCTKCFGTGLGTKRLKNFQRDPVFAKVIRRLQADRADVNNIDKLQAEVAEAVQAWDNRQARKKAKKAADDAAKDEKVMGVF